MKRILATSLTALMVAAPLALAAPADADTPGCVTRTEYRKLHEGDTKARVTRVFDTKGRRLSIASSGGVKSQVRSYNTCSQLSYVSIAFGKNGSRPWKVAAKSAVWVS